MTKIKLCGLSRLADIEAANALLPEFIGFVFAPGSRRYVSPRQAAMLKHHLDPRIQAVGVFVNEPAKHIAELLEQNIIDLAQLHGNETDEDIRVLHTMTDKPVIQAFTIRTEQDSSAAEKSCADYILLDSGSGGTGESFDWKLLKNINRLYFLAGGLRPDNVKNAVRLLHPWAVDVSSGIETDKMKDIHKMRLFVGTVRGKEEKE